jgi:hypothetical protein
MKAVARTARGTVHRPEIVSRPLVAIRRIEYDEEARTMKKGFLALAAVLLLSAPSIQAGQVDGCMTIVSTSCSPMRVSICPAGDFEQIRYGCGMTTDYIEIQVKNTAGNPVPGIPRTDYWLDACDPAQQLCLCCQPIIADAETDILGEARICGPIAAGGCVLTQGIYIVIQGQMILQQPACVSPVCLNIVLVSPDLTADCMVNLSDLGVFGLSNNTQQGQPLFNPCCDYNDDNKCNLSDFAFLGEHYQHQCR